MNSSATSAYDEHFKLVVDAISEGRLVVFLGAGANLCDRLPGAKWEPTVTDFLPSGNELANHLAFKLPVRDPEYCPVPQCPMPFRDLLRVSQNVVTSRDEGPLYLALNDIFTKNVPPTSVHRFVASLNSHKDSAGNEWHPLFVTTNYDDLIEKVLKQNKRRFEVVYFNPASDDPFGGRFWHKTYYDVVRRREGHVIKEGNSYPHEFFREMPVVLKIHGTIDRHRERRNEAFVITEDDYLSYMAEAPLERFLPCDIHLKLQSSYILLLGYSLRDWNVRIFLRRLKGKKKDRWRTWSVLLSASEGEKTFWLKKGVELIEMDLAQYVQRLDQELKNRTAKSGR